jgi:hypothetical protein
VQHDGGARRHPCRSSIGNTHRRLFFNESAGPESVAGPEQNSDLSVRDGSDRSTFKCMGIMFRSPGRLESSESFDHRITCRNLAITDDDFVQQYFQVIISKQIVNMKYYGTFMD